MGERDIKKSHNRLRFVMAILVVLLVMVFPGHPTEFTLSTLWQLPIELPIVIMALLLTPAWARKTLCGFLAFIALILLLLRLADIGSYFAFNRRFNPVLELHLIGDGWNLASTSIGPIQALLIVCAALLLLLILVWFLYRCLLHIATYEGTWRRHIIGLAAMGVAVIAVGIQAEKVYDYQGPAQIKIVPELSLRISRIANSIADQKAFAAELAVDSVLDNDRPEFSALKGKDIIIVFVESYGRGYLDSERFSSLAHKRLNAAQDTLDQAGMQSKSGWFTSPIRGGRSWLAHASFQSGLKIDNQARFDRLITTHRASLSALFESAGWETVGIMPAIQFDWPEGDWYDYQKTYEAKDMEYMGQRFGYVTMPDQYTLSHFQNEIREPSDKPIMATLALLTTHAPWTPLPEKLDWNSIGDGSIYDGSHRYGEKISWKYRTKVQDMYAQSFDYTLDVLGEFAARYGDNAVMIILGDHQPAPIINGWGKSGDVPVHVISNDEAIMQRLPDTHWTKGMLPSANVLSQPMWEIRDTFSRIFE